MRRSSTRNPPTRLRTVRLATPPRAQPRRSFGCCRAQSEDFHSYRLMEGSIARSACAYIGESVYLDVAMRWSCGEPAVCPMEMRTESARLELPDAPAAQPLLADGAVDWNAPAAAHRRRRRRRGVRRPRRRRDRGRAASHRRLSRAGLDVRDGCPAHPERRALHLSGRSLPSTSVSPCGIPSASRCMSKPSTSTRERSGPSRRRCAVQCEHGARSLRRERDSRIGVSAPCSRHLGAEVIRLTPRWDVARTAGPRSRSALRPLTLREASVP